MAGRVIGTMITWLSAIRGWLAPQSRRLTLLKWAIIVIFVGLLADIALKILVGPGRALEAISVVGGAEKPDRWCDVVFVHGLGGGAQDTWTCAETNFCWPAELGKQFPNICFWSIAYAASPTKLTGRPMSIGERSRNLLERLRFKGIGERDLIFVTHSLGGLVVKKMLRDALTLKNKDWEAIADHTKAVVFLATPHSGSDLAGYVEKLVPWLPTEIVKELRPSTEDLADVNVWYRNSVPDRDIASYVYFETEPTDGIIIVNRASADPGINGVTPIPVQATHLTICKPIDRDDFIYQAVARIISDQIDPVKTVFAVSFLEFVQQFNAVRHDSTRLTEFKKQHVGQKLHWTAIVRNVFPSKEAPSYSIAPDQKTTGENQVQAGCLIRDFRADIQEGATVEIEGILDENTNELGAILRNCKLRPATK